MHKWKLFLTRILCFSLFFLCSGCKPAISPPTQEPLISKPQQPVDPFTPTKPSNDSNNSTENYICGMVENWTDTGAFSPVMTISSSGQVIWLDILTNEMLANNADQLPSNFMIFDPIVKEKKDLSGGTSYGLSGYSKYNRVSNCPDAKVDPTKTIQAKPAEIQFPTNMPVLVMAWYPPDAINPNILDIKETGLKTNISNLQDYVDQLAKEGARIASEGTRYHGFKDINSPIYLQYSILEILEFFEPMPRGFPLGNKSFRPNYAQIFVDQEICDYVDTHGVREVWIYGYHSDNIVPDESKMSSLFGDISNAYPHDDEIDPQFRLPKCNHSYIMYNFNYAREIETNIHNRLHQIENVIFYAENKGYPPNPDNVIGSLFWNDFSFWGDLGKRQGYRASCGNTHSAPNTVGDYVYASKEIRENNCETWNPDDSRTTYVMNDCSQWDCTEMGFYLWYMQNIPGYGNGIQYRGLWMRNWWDAVADFNTFITEEHSLFTADTSKVLIPTPDISFINDLPNSTPQPLGISDHPVFEYPQDQQILDYGKDYLLKVAPFKDATGYLWGFFQDGKLIWDNLRDEGTLSGNSYNILAGSKAHSLINHGELQIWVRGLVDNEYSEAAVITIQLRSDDHPVFEYPQDQQVLDYGGEYLFKIKPYKNATQYLWQFFQNGKLIWENLRDEGTLSSTEYAIISGSPAHNKVQMGELEIHVSAFENGKYSQAGVITIQFKKR